MAVSESAARRIGRPDAQASETLDRLILATATQSFIDHGYAATSIEKVAAQAEVGKQTIYRRYRSKEELFKASVGALIGSLLTRADAAAKFSADPLAALREACATFLETVARPDSIAMYRILIAESRRFPTLADHALESTSEPFHAIIRRLLDAAARAGRLRADHDLDLLSRILIGMVSGWALNQWLLGGQALSTEAERAAFLDTALSIFLNGVVIDSCLLYTS
ncbi:MAG TPA: TetR/AcrR family transcriptional regulator, partial [Rhodospirillum rubrum]|nr:TetR/AcrR family transcriptional regulator [Rhodospirillum rubrum]